MSEAIPWLHWLALARDVGVQPQMFWRLSLREWRALMRGPAAARLDRAGFDALTARFPDEQDG